MVVPELIVKVRVVVVFIVRLIVTGVAKVIPGASTEESTSRVPFKLRVTPVAGKVEVLLTIKLPATLKVGLAAVVNVAPLLLVKLPLRVKEDDPEVLIVPLLVIPERVKELIPVALKFLPEFMVNLPFPDNEDKLFALRSEALVKVPQSKTQEEAEERLKVPLLVIVPFTLVLTVPLPVIVPLLIKLYEFPGFPQG